MNQLPGLLFSAVVTSWLVAVPAASPAVFVVPSPATPTIASALAVAANEDTIDVLPGTYFEHDLEIQRRVTLRGIAGASQTAIDAQGLGRVLTINTERVVIEGLTVTHGAASTGAGIDATGAPVLTIRSCIISENHASSNGGGLSIGIGIGAFPLTLVDSELSGNSAIFRGGALWTNDVDLTITRCIFRNNTAERAGAADFWQAIGSVTDCAFVSNAASVEGGALYYDLSAVSVQGCTFHGNAAPQAPAIARASGPVTRTIVSASSTLPGRLPVSCAASVSFSCCDFYGNAGGNALCGTDGGGNFSADPLFCDAAGGDFRLHEDSPCLPGQHPDETDCGGTIGALDVGCGSGTGVDEEMEATSWSRVKARYR